ncbi:DNA polymerase [Clostridium culturomicium]|uniref:DNA polymerase n=1 Tax=Clostridium culturomicium TaxID=1499683 RepID=UPI00385774AC
MKTLAIDIETYSDIDLKRSGVYPYAASDSFEILLFAYVVDEGEVKVVDLAKGEELPQEVVDGIKDEKVIKSAFNAAFERVCLSCYRGEYLSPKSWRCTAVQAASLSLPFSLEDVGHVLHLEKQKLGEGKELIKYFSMPCKSTKANGNRIRNLPQDDEEKWELFKEYCKRDVEVERLISKRLSRYPLSLKEEEAYELDQEINDRGVLVDMNLVNSAIAMDELFKGAALNKAKNLTCLENPNSPTQLKTWLKDRGMEVDSLSKKSVEELMALKGERSESDASIKEVLNLRLQLSKTSIKKYEAIERSACLDKRVRGLFQFYGANRTGRWAGRLVQVQNLPQNHLKNLDLTRSLVKEGNFHSLNLLYDNLPGVLSELIRTTFIPKENHTFLVADYSAIEARVIAWLAMETWRLEVFKTHGKIYEASASKMFKVPMDSITKDSPLRQKGKVAELALGYGGSVGALTAMGALEKGLTAEELPGIVEAWRRANPNITKLWWNIGKAAIMVITRGGQVQVGRINLFYQDGIMFITLPSGRKLSYVRAKVLEKEHGRKVITYEGLGTSKKWTSLQTYGPKLVENIVQGIARDLLAEAMASLSKAGFKIVMHIHDEVVIETPKDGDSLEDICKIMKTAPTWARGLILDVDGFQCDYYKK